MKTVFLSIAILAATTLNSVAREEFDGFFWEKIGENPEYGEIVKTAYINGLTAGYNNGFMFGHIWGHALGERAIITVVEREVGTSKGVAEAVVKAKAEAETQELKRWSISPTQKGRFTEGTISYYVRELDSFLKTYPLCRRYRIDVLITSLLRVWDKERTSTYREIGEKCAEGVK